MLEKALEEAHVAGVKPMESAPPSLLTPILTRVSNIRSLLSFCQIGPPPSRRVSI
jgi:hypothetical protein